MKWMVTGGCGFVGGNLVDQLLASGDEVIVVDNLSRCGSRDNLLWLQARHTDKWRFVEADVRDAHCMSRLMKDVQPNFVAHLAGQVAMTTSLADPRLDFETNALGTFNVLEAVRLHAPHAAVLYSSTNKVYGSLDQFSFRETATRYEVIDYPHGFDESLQLDGCSPYGCSKLCAEQYCRDYYRMYGIQTVVLRHSSMYGGRQFATYDQGWIGWFCQKAVEAERGVGESFSISGDGKQVRDVLHADDLVRVYVRVAERMHAVAGSIYNIGGGISNSLSLLELFHLLEQLTGAYLSFERRPWRLADQKVFVADNRRALVDLEWQPRVDKHTGLQRMLQWSRELQLQ
jgi:CDP-paratose 2-epimerase